MPFSFYPEYFVPDSTGAHNCDELGRTTRAIVSGYFRTRTHVARLVRGESRCLVADFHGAIAPARSIVSATWRTTQNQAVRMSNARIAADGRSVEVDIVCQSGGVSAVKVDATLDNGEIYNQVFRVEIRWSPVFSGEPQPVIGPSELTATA